MRKTLTQIGTETEVNSLSHSAIPLKAMRARSIDLELSPSWIDPDNRLRMLVAQENHVVVGRDDDLARGFRMFKYRPIRRAPGWSPILDVADMAGVETQLAQGPCDSGRKQLVEQKSNLGRRQRTVAAAFMRLARTPRRPQPMQLLGRSPRQHPRRPHRPRPVRTRSEWESSSPRCTGHLPVLRD